MSTCSFWYTLYMEVFFKWKKKLSWIFFCSWIFQNFEFLPAYVIFKTRSVVILCTTLTSIVIKDITQRDIICGFIDWDYIVQMYQVRIVTALANHLRKIPLTQNKRRLTSFTTKNIHLFIRSTRQTLGNGAETEFHKEEDDIVERKA